MRELLLFLGEEAVFLLVKSVIGGRNNRVRVL